MKSNIRVNAVHEIVQGHLDEFKEMGARMIEKVAAGEPGYLSYEWFLSDDESTLTIVGLLEDSAAVMERISPARAT
jgi:quinol monooxygenase YgiN